MNIRPNIYTDNERCLYLEYNNLVKRVNVPFEPWFLQGDFSFEIRFKLLTPFQGGSSYQYPFAVIPASGNDNLQLRMDATSVRFFWRDAAGSIRNLNVAYTVGHWQHVVVTFEHGVAIRYYKNGVQVAENTTNTDLQRTATSYKAYVGAGNLGSGNFRQANGFFRGYRFFNKALDATEVAELYAGDPSRITLAKPSLQGNIVTEILFNQENSTVLRDTSPRRIHGSLENFGNDTLYRGNAWQVAPTPYNLLPETQAIIDAMTVKPPPIRTLRMDEAVRALLDSGEWNKLDLLYITNAHDQQAARINWKNPGSHTLTEIDSPTWTKNVGYSGNGAGYLKTGYNPSNDAVNFTLNLNAIGSLHNNGVGNTGVADMGCSDGVNDILLLPRNGGQLRIRNNSASGLQVGVSRGNLAEEFIGVKRLDSATVKLHAEGDTINTDLSLASNGIPDAELYLMAWNNNGTAELFATSSYTYKGWYVGGDVDPVKLNDIIVTHLL